MQGKEGEKLPNFTSECANVRENSEQLLYVNIQLMAETGLCNCSLSIGP